MNEPVSLAGAETIARPKTVHSGLVPFFVLTFITTWAIDAALPLFPSLRNVLSSLMSPLVKTGLVKDPPFLLCVAAYAPAAWGIYLTRRYSGKAGLREKEDPSLTLVFSCTLLKNKADAEHSKQRGVDVGMESDQPAQPRLKRSLDKGVVEVWQVGQQAVNGCQQ